MPNYYLRGSGSDYGSVLNQGRRRRRRRRNPLPLILILIALVAALIFVIGKLRSRNSPGAGPENPQAAEETAEADDALLTDLSLPGSRNLVGDAGNKKNTSGNTASGNTASGSQSGNTNNNTNSANTSAGNNTSSGNNASGSNASKSGSNAAPANTTQTTSNGNTQTVVTYTKDGPVYSTKTAESDPSKQTVRATAPNTGDSQKPILYGLLGLAAVAVIVVIVLKRKNKNADEENDDNSEEEK